MSNKTIQCRLVASEATRKYLWQLMAEKNTPLVNELLHQIATHPNFEDWRQTGQLPQKAVKDLCQALKKDPCFSEQPGRFYTSAWTLAHRIFKSWFALQQKLRQKIARLTQKLAILQSDEELCNASGQTLEALQNQAKQLLAQAEEALRKDSKAAEQQDSKQTKTYKETLLGILYQEYDQSMTSFDKWPLIYLLKNGGKIPQKSENTKNFYRKRRKVQILLERALEQLQDTRVPQGRELTDIKWLQTLETAINQVPINELEAADWQAELLQEVSPVPFPVAYETNEDLKWSKNAKGRLCVSFNGLSNKNTKRQPYIFEIYCDQRDFHWFSRFFEDYHLKKTTKQHSSALFSLRSARLGWTVSNSSNAQAADPWQHNHLYLHCSVDTQLWSAEGTEQVRQAAIDKATRIINSSKKKGSLTENQKKNVQKKQKTLALLENDFPRPSRPVFAGNPNILLGGSFGLDKPATVAVVNISKQKAITYRSIRQLLGENYKLLAQHRFQQSRNAKRRHQNQKKGAFNGYSESNLGEYIDRLIAKAIVELAKAYQVSSIVLPKQEDMRETIQAEVKARAENKIPGFKEGQRQYALQYRSSVHRWSYGRLIDCINNKAAQVGIPIEFAKQPFQGTPQEKAREITISAYQYRLDREVS